MWSLPNSVSVIDSPDVEEGGFVEVFVEEDLFISGVNWLGKHLARNKLSPPSAELEHTKRVNITIHLTDIISDAA